MAEVPLQKSKTPEAIRGKETRKNVDENGQFVDETTPEAKKLAAAKARRLAAHEDRVRRESVKTRKMPETVAAIKKVKGIRDEAGTGTEWAEWSTEPPTSLVKVKELGLLSPVSSDLLPTSGKGYIDPFADIEPDPFAAEGPETLFMPGDFVRIVPGTNSLYDNREGKVLSVIFDSPEPVGKPMYHVALITEQNVQARTIRFSENQLQVAHDHETDAGDYVDGFHVTIYPAGTLDMCDAVISGVAGIGRDIVCGEDAAYKYVREPDGSVSYACEEHRDYIAERALDFDHPWEMQSPTVISPVMSLIEPSVLHAYVRKDTEFLKRLVTLS